MMLIASVLKWSSTIDVTGAATLLLAIMTFVSVIVGGLALHRNQSEIDLSRREVEEAHRPVLIPVVEFTPGNLSRPDRPAYVGDGRLLVRLKNIGMGPALQIEAIAALLGRAATANPGPAQDTALLTGLGMGQQHEFTIKTRFTGDHIPPFQLSLHYSDVAGKEWVTIARYSPEHAAYVEMGINAYADGPHLNGPRFGARQRSDAYD
jgi:hypothetical protein